MNEQIERRLDAEAASESRGYFRLPPRPGGVATAAKNGPARWSTPRADVEVRPLASVADLLDAAKSEER